MTKRRWRWRRWWWRRRRLANRQRFSSARGSIASGNCLTYVNTCAHTYVKTLFCRTYFRQVAAAPAGRSTIIACFQRNSFRWNLLRRNCLKTDASTRVLSRAGKVRWASTGSCVGYWLHHLPCSCSSPYTTRAPHNSVHFTLDSDAARGQTATTIAITQHLHLLNSHYTRYNNDAARYQNAHTQQAFLLSLVSACSMRPTDG